MTVTATRAREDRLLSNVSRRHNVEGLVANQILSKIIVRKSTGLIGKYGNEHLRIVHDLVGGMTEYPIITVDTKTSNRYIMEKHGLSVNVTEEEKDNELQPFDALQDATMDVTDRLMLGREKALADVLTATATYTVSNFKTLSGTSQYNEKDTSDPLGDFEQARASIFKQTGKDTRMKGGFAVITWDVENALSFHPDLLDLYKFVSTVGAGLNLEQLKQAMKVDRIIMAMSQVDVTKEGQDTATPIPTWGKNIVFGFAPFTGTKKMTTLGFNVTKSDSVRVFRDKIISPPNADKIQVDITYDDLITQNGAAFLIKNAVA